MLDPADDPPRKGEWRFTINVIELYGFVRRWWRARQFARALARVEKNLGKRN